MFHYIQNFAYELFLHYIRPLSVINGLELILIGFVIYKFYRYVTGTHAEQLMKGVFMLLLALLFSKIFKLQIIGRVLESIVNIVIFSMVVIFQPELRRLLGYIGQASTLNKNIFSFETEEEVKSQIEELTEAVKYLSKSHTGALIVILNTNDANNYIEVGTKLDAKVSTELLLTIFHPNTPLHDGAVVINGDKIIAAGVLLPLTEDPKLSWQYGTRHRAAIGMSEISDASCIVVSEETGNISMAKNGVLNKFPTPDELKTELEFIYGFSETMLEKQKEPVKFKFNKVLLKKLSKFWSIDKKEEA